MIFMKIYVAVSYDARCTLNERLVLYQDVELLDKHIAQTGGLTLVEQDFSSSGDSQGGLDPNAGLKWCVAEADLVVCFGNLPSNGFGTIVGEAMSKLQKPGLIFLKEKYPYGNALLYASGMKDIHCKILKGVYPMEKAIRVLSCWPEAIVNQQLQAVTQLL